MAKRSSLQENCGGKNDAVEQLGLMGQHKAERARGNIFGRDTWRICDFRALCAFLIYLTLSLFFFGRQLFGGLSDFHIGMSPDPGHVIWFLEWWPHAITHWLNPIITCSLWTPHPLNVLWTISIPLASVVATPITLTFGPVASFNVLCLLSAPLDAWCTFVLCRYMSRDYGISLLGGHVFGFSAFVLGQMVSGHLQMLLVFCVPMIVYVTVRRFMGEITELRFTILLTLLLLGQLLLSFEVFATMSLLMGLALLLANGRAFDLLRPIVRSYAITMIVASPLLYYFFTVGFRRTPFFTPEGFSADLLNFFVPTPTNELGRFAIVETASSHFVNGWIMLAADGAYFSLPLLVIAGLYGWSNWREPLGKLLTSCLIVIALLSLGPMLHIAGHTFPIALPWWLVAQLPLFRDAVPVCLSMYAFVVLALIVSLWLAATDAHPISKLVAVAAILAFNLPNLSAAFWSRPTSTPLFFGSGIYRNYIRKGETVLILPYAYTGDSMLWQAQAHMYFNMVESTIPPPDEFRRWPIFAALTIRNYVPDASEQFSAFLSAHGVSAIVVTDEALATWQGFLSTLHVKPVTVDDVSLYGIPTQSFDAETTWRNLRARFDTERLVTLVTGAEKYLSEGRDLDSLSAVKAEELNLIPRTSLLGPPVLLVPGVRIASERKADPHLADGLWLGKTSDGLVGVGAHVWYSAVAPMIEQLRGVTSGIYFPYPNKWAASAPRPEEPDGWLLITFTREQLARAAKLLETSATPSAQKTSRANTSVFVPARSLRE